MATHDPAVEKINALQAQIKNIELGLDEEVPPPEKKFLMLPITQWKKIAIGMCVASAGAVLVYVAQVLLDLPPSYMTPIYVAVAGVLANIGRKWLEVIIGPYALPQQ